MYNHKIVYIMCYTIVKRIRNFGCKPIVIAGSINRRVCALSLTVAETRSAGRDTVLLRLISSDRLTLPAAAPGAHVTLMLPENCERQYSILNPSPDPNCYEVAVQRESGGRGGSVYLVDMLREGDGVTARPPRNLFPLDEHAPYSVLIGGGIGIAPLLAMRRRLIQLQRPYQLHAAFRGLDHLLLGERLAEGQYNMHLDDRDGGLFPLASTIAAAPREAHLYCCGPVSMIEAFAFAARADGRDETMIHVEYFASPPAPPANSSITVELARSGLTVMVPPGRSILDAVREAGVPATSSCENGTCGACEVHVLAGIPDHFDAVLTPREKLVGDRMMICCSGALTSRLVIDL